MILSSNRAALELIVEAIGRTGLTVGSDIALALDVANSVVLRADPERRWQVMLYLNNNSNRPIAPLLHCQFSNAGKPVEETRVLLPAVGGGVRVGLTIYGPKTSLFVDRAICKVESP